MSFNITFKLSETEERMFRELRKINLRHPGMVNAKVQRLLKLDEYSDANMQAVRLEWLKLGGK